MSRAPIWDGGRVASRSARARAIGLLAGALALLVPGCDGSPGTGREASGRASEPPPRRFAPVTWREAFRVGGTLDDTLLLQPGRLAADRGGVVVVDLHGGRAMRFDTAGALRWSWGRKGRGPDELSHPRDVKLDAAGRTWILDVENGRLVVLSRAGRALRRIRLNRVGRPDDFVPLGDGGALVLVADPERPLVRIDAAGTVRDRRALPWPGLASLDPLVAQLVVGGDPITGRWAAAFQLGDGFLAFEGPRWLGYRGRFVEPVPFGRAVRHRSADRLGRSRTVTALASPTFAAWSVGVWRDAIGVLFVGRTELGGRLLDIYDVDDGAYRETLVLPRAVNQIARAEETLYATFADPAPTLVAWRAERPAPEPGAGPETRTGRRP